MTSERPRVFVTRRLPGGALDRLGQHADTDVWGAELPPTPEQLKERVIDAQGLLCLLTDRVDAGLLSGAPALRVISNMAVGTDNVQLAAATARGIPVGYTPGVLTETTADFAFALLLAAARLVPQGDRLVRVGEWRTWDPNLLLGHDVYAATLGIVGLGAIGQAVARRAQGFSMRILYTRRSETASPVDIRASRTTLDDLLRESDFVSLHVPLTDETRYLIGRRELMSMKPGAILINTSRGPVIDEEALAEVLESGHLAAAALDVTEYEPIDPRSQLLRLPNVIITPHIASGSLDTRRLMANMAVDNLLAGLEGRRLPNCANPEVYASGAPQVLGA